MNEDIQPPRWADKFLRWLCAEDVLETLQGDLYELYGKRIFQRGRLIANLCFVRDVFDVCRPFAIRSFRPAHLTYDVMYKSYFKTGWRNLSASKVLSIVKILGLSLSLSVCMLIFLYTKDEVSYDRFHDNQARLFRVVQTLKAGENPSRAMGITNGANAADFLRFKYRDIKGDFIVFYREKIKNATKSNKKPIKIYLSSELKELMYKIGNPNKPDNYIFKCYTDDMSEEEKYNARCRFNRIVSKSLKRITKDLNLEKTISIGKARHTLTNILKKNQVDREFVKDILGHTSIITADNYYDQFEDDQHTS